MNEWNGTSASDFNERTVPGATLDRPGDALGYEKPPRNDVAIPCVHDDVDVLVEQVTFDYVGLHRLRLRVSESSHDIFYVPRLRIRVGKKLGEAMNQATFSDWQAKAAKLRIPSHAFIDGKHVAAANGKTFDCLSPIDGRVLAQVARCDALDVDRVVQVSRRLFESGAWSETKPTHRKKVLVRLCLYTGP